MTLQSEKSKLCEIQPKNSFFFNKKIANQKRGIMERI